MSLSIVTSDSPPREPAVEALSWASACVGEALCDAASRLATPASLGQAWLLRGAFSRASRDSLWPSKPDTYGGRKDPELWLYGVDLYYWCGPRSSAVTQTLWQDAARLA